jgi:hypothetical protein
LAAECTLKEGPKCLTQEPKVAYLQNTNFETNAAFKIFIFLQISSRVM